MNKVAAIIVTFNRKDKLLRCIDAVSMQTSDVQPDIILVDNNSSDGTGELIRQYKSEHKDKGGKIFYHNLGYNSGGAGGFCFGLRKAAESGYDFMWIMDDDCIPASDALEQFLRFDSRFKGDYGFLSGKALWKDGTPCVMNIQRQTVTRNISFPVSDPVPVEMASFASLFIPAGIVREAGLPMRKFFIWTDDWEYTRRISRRHICWMIPSSQVIHDTESNTGANLASAPDDRLDRFRYLYRNDVYLYRREGIRGAAYEAARLCLHTARIAASKNSAAGKMKRIGIMLRGTFEGLSFFPEPERAMARKGEER